jgi:putative membrane protein
MTWNKAMKVAAATVLIAMPAVSQTTTPVREQRILSFIHETNVLEIEAAKQALSSSSSDAVKNLAQQMIDDHQAADAQVRTYAGAHGIDVDQLRSQLDDISQERLEQARRDRTVGSATGEWAWTWGNTLQRRRDDDQELAKLRTLKGGAFDREFVGAMVDGHGKAIDRLTSAKNGNISPDLRALIEGLLPTIRNHLEMAQSVQATVAKN